VPALFAIEKPGAHRRHVAALAPLVLPIAREREEGAPTQRAHLSTIGISARSEMKAVGNSFALVMQGSRERGAA
jgi:hypothetical protein